MDRFETDAVADDAGIVHVAVGTPRQAVHVVVEAISAPAVRDQQAATDPVAGQLIADLRAFRATLPHHAWLDDEQIRAARDEGRA